MDPLVESAAQRGIRELTLVSKVQPWENRYLLPPSLLRCNSLRQLSLVECQFPQPMPPSVFPNLKELRLTSVTLDNDSLQILLSCCRSLETLHFISFGAIQVCSISSPSLRKLVWNNIITLELIIKDAPNLESLMFSEYTTNFCNGVKVLNAPKLEQLGFLCADFRALQLGATFFNQQMALNLGKKKIEASPCQMKMLSSVKTLAIKMEPSFDETIPDLLRCFPCLENLDILKYEGSGGRYYSDTGIWDGQGFRSFLDHLKTVTMKGFYGDQSDVELLKFLVVHGKELRKITLLCCKSITEKFVKFKRQQLCIEKRASSDLELVFLRDTEKNNNFWAWHEFHYSSRHNLTES